MLTVSIPTWRTPPDLLERSIRSVLASEDADLRLVVVVDGDQRMPRLPADHRLVVHELATNRGRYFADAVVVGAIGTSPDQSWAPLDSDDWVDPRHYGRMIQALDRSEGVVLSPYWRREPGRRSKLVEPSRRLSTPHDGTFRHLMHWCAGIYRTDRVHLAGGVHPGYRVGYDTLFVLLLRMTGPIETLRRPGYHWERRREGSLTTSPETRFGSPHRVEARRGLVGLHDRAWAAEARRVGDVVRADIAADLREAVLEESTRLRREL